MLKAVNLLSDIFFLGKLKRCKFRRVKGLCEGPDECWGVTFLERKGVVRIEMDPDDVCDDERDQGKRLSRIGTLLLGGVHAFQALYSCEICCSHHCRSQSFDALYGRTWHARAWISLAARVQRTAGFVLGVDVGLGICQSIMHEYRAQRLMLNDADWIKLTSLEPYELGRN